MGVNSLILSGLALLSAVVNLILFVWRVKRENRRYESLVIYIDTSDSKTVTAAKNSARDSVSELLDGYDKKLEGFDNKISALEQGICPDYEAALAAKESVDRFSEGVMNILTYGNPVPQKKEKEEAREDKG